ncbi:Uncharacterised protein [Klebsiella oxytoca]|nr:Uncharacterised protein [Klebsiella oxytoca]
MQGDTVGNRGHAEFTHAVVDIVTGSVFVDGLRAGPQGQVTWRQVSGAAEELRQQRAEGFNGVLRRFTAGDFRRVSLQLRDEFVRFRVEISRHLAFHTAGEFCCFLREGSGVGGEFLVPRGLFRLTGFFRIPLGIDFRRNFKRRVFPAERFAGQRDFRVAQRRAVGVVGTGFVRRTETDDGFAHQQGRFVGDRTRFFHRAFNRVSIVTVNAAHHVPAVGFKALRGVIGEPAFDVTVDGDAVVVIERHQLAQFQGTGQGAYLVRDTFHHAAVAHERISEVVNDVVARAVELRRQGFLRNRHPHRIRNALPQRSGSGFHARGVAHFRVARGSGVQLTEVLQLFDWQIVAGEVQQAVDQHRAVTVGQHEAVAIGPGRVLRIMVQEITPQDFGNVSHTHRGTRVAGFGFLYCVHAQRTNSVSKLFT